MNKKTVIIVISVIVVLILAGIGYSLVFNSKKDKIVGTIKTIKDLEKEEKGKNDSSSDVKDIEVPKESAKEDTTSAKRMKFIIGKEEKINGGSLLSVNKFQLLIPEKLQSIGYDKENKDGVLKFTSKDGKYKCIVVQLTDNYKMPKESEIEDLYNYPEYTVVDDEVYDQDNADAVKLHEDKLEEISTKYYKKLGYTEKYTPDYVLTSKELNSLIGEFYLDTETSGVGRNAIYPGYETYAYYNWGKVTKYDIPYSSEDGQDKSKISLCLYLFEYFNSNDDVPNIELWRF